MLAVVKVECSKTAATTLKRAKRPIKILKRGRPIKTKPEQALTSSEANVDVDPTTPQKHEGDAGSAGKRRKTDGPEAAGSAATTPHKIAAKVWPAAKLKQLAEAAKLKRAKLKEEKLEQAAPKAEPALAAEKKPSSPSGFSFFPPAKAPKAEPASGKLQGHKGGLLPWVRGELEHALAGVAKEAAGGSLAVTRQDVEAWLETPAADRIHALQLCAGCCKTVALMAPEQELLLESFVDRVAFEADLCHAPMSGVRNAESDEVADMPGILAEFESFLSELTVISESTRNGYVRNFIRAFRHDGKAPEEMAGATYHDALKHTWEDVAGSRNMLASVVKFNHFWKQRGGRPFTHSTGASRSQATLVPGSIPRRLPSDGDGSEEKRAEEGLPEGWCYHSNGGGGTIWAWTSPEGEWFMSRAELNRKRNPPPPPALKFATELGDVGPPPPPAEKTAGDAAGGATRCCNACKIVLDESCMAAYWNDSGAPVEAEDKSLRKMTDFFGKKAA